MMYYERTILKLVAVVYGSASKMLLYHLSIIFPTPASLTMYMVWLVNLNSFVLSFEVSELLCYLLVDVIN